MHVGLGRAIQDKHDRACEPRRFVHLRHCALPSEASFARRATTVASLVATVTVTTTVCVTWEAFAEY